MFSAQRCVTGLHKSDNYDDTALMANRGIVDLKSSEDGVVKEQS